MCPRSNDQFSYSEQQHFCQMSLKQCQAPVFLMGSGPCSSFQLLDFLELLLFACSTAVSSLKSPANRCFNFQACHLWIFKIWIIWIITQRPATHEAVWCLDCGACVQGNLCEHPGVTPEHARRGRDIGSAATLQTGFLKRGWQQQKTDCAEGSF